MAHTLLFAKGLPPEAPVRSSWGLRGWAGGVKVSGVNSQELVTDLVEESADQIPNSWTFIAAFI